MWHDGDALPGVAALSLGVGVLLFAAIDFGLWDAKKARDRFDRSLHRLLKQESDDGPPLSGSE